MFKITKFFCALSLAFMLLGCASSGSVSRNAPLWVTAADDAYDSGKYLNAVGSASERQSAESAAMAQLARNIRQNIVAVSDVRKTMSGNDSAGYDTQYDYSASVAAESSVQNIPGVTFRETWTAADGTVYVLAQLEREETGRYYRKRIDERTVVIESEIVYADANEGSFEALAALSNAEQLASENQEDMDMLAGINPDMYRLVSPDYVSAAAVAVLAARQQEKVLVSVSVKGDSANRITKAFETVLVDSGLRVASDGETCRYVLNASVDITEVEGNQKYEYVRYVLTAELFDSVSNKSFVPYTENGREAHISQSEAAQRAYRTVEQSIAKNYKPLVEEYLSSLR